MIARFRLPVLFAAIALVAVSCAETEPDPAAFSGDLAAGNPTEDAADEGEVSGEAPEPRDPSPAQIAELDAALAATPEGCDVLDTRSCLLPFPSDFLTEEDPSSPTLRRVAFPEGQLPNASGVTLDPTAWNELDGFTPSTPIVVHVPDLDDELTDLPPRTTSGCRSPRSRPRSSSTWTPVSSCRTGPRWTSGPRTPSSGP